MLITTLHKLSVPSEISDFLIRRPIHLYFIWNTKIWNTYYYTGNVQEKRDNFVYS